MMSRVISQVFLAIVLISAPLCVLALGMGPLQVRSSLNQLMDAEIELFETQDVELSTVNVGLASRRAFEQAGLDRSAVLSDLIFAVETRPDGSAFIKITSRRPIREPILNFLVEVKWPQGRLQREFAVLLDLAPAVTGRRAPLPVTRLQASPRTPPQDGPFGTYGPVARGETLWEIATKLRPDDSVSTQQMMQRLLRANPGAFRNGDINRLLAGVTLRVPGARPSAVPDPASPPAVAAAPRPAAVPPPPATPPPEQRQVRLVSPDAEPAPAPVRSPPTLAEPYRIKLAQGRPQLRLAQLDALRERRSIMSFDQSALSAAAPTAPAAPPALGDDTVELPPSTAADDPFAGLEAISGVAEAPELPLATEPPDIFAGTEATAEDALPDEAASQPETPSPFTATPDNTFDEPANPFADANPLPGTATDSPEATPELTELTDTFSDPASQETGTAESASPVTEAPVAPPPTNPDSGIASPVADRSTTAPLPAETAPPENDSILSPLTNLAQMLLGDPVLLIVSAVGLLALVTLVILLVRFFLQKPEAEEEDSEALLFDTIGDEDTAVPEPMTTLPPTSTITAATQPSAPNVLEQVDLLLAVNDYPKAAELLQQQLAQNPDDIELLSRLLDVHFAANDRDAFIATADKLHAMLQDETDPVWGRAFDMGQQICPDHPLFGGAEPGAVATRKTDMLADAFSELSLDLTERTGMPEATRPPGPLTQKPAANTAQPTTAVPMTATPITAPPSRAPAAPAGSEPGHDKLAAQLDSLEFNPPTGVAEANTADPVTAPLEIDLSKTQSATAAEPDDSLQDLVIDLKDLGIDDEATAATDQTTEIPASGVEDYVTTKLDLAIAYMDMGDPVGARSLLQEVEQEGDTSQQQHARELLAQLG